MKIDKCHCGKTPNNLRISPPPTEYSVASGDCCDMWIVGFKSENKTGLELQELAIQAWNDRIKKAPKF